MFRPVVVAIALFVVAPVASAGDTELEKRLKEAVNEFARKREDAKTQALLDIDKAITKVRNAKGLTAAARMDKLKEYEDAKSTFASKAEFTRDEEDFVLLELKYNRAVNKGFVPCAKLADEVIEKGNKAADTELAAKGLQMKKDVEGQLPGVGKMTAGSKWHGTFTRGGATIPYHLNLNKAGAGGSFRAHVDDNPGAGGHWYYDVEGQTSGLGVEFALSTVGRGNLKAFVAKGVVSGDRLIAEVSQSTGKNLTLGVLVLKLVK